MRHDLRVTYASSHGQTSISSLFESGSLRLRHPRGAICEAILLNTAGGVVPGDEMIVDVELGPSARVMISSVAAEKVYRTGGEDSTIAMTLRVGAGARLAWLPQETILFDQVRLRRRICIDAAVDAEVLACEIIEFGRHAFGEEAIRGLLTESWRVRRDGLLIHADEGRLDGEIGSSLDRPAVGVGARAVAQMLYVSSVIDGLCERLESVLATFRSREPGLAGGVTAKDGIVLARLLARSATDLRPCIARLIETVPGFLLPRCWR